MNFTEKEKHENLELTDNQLIGSKTININYFYMFVLS